jgi:hypothetical protein
MKCLKFQVSVAPPKTLANQLVSSAFFSSVPSSVALSGNHGKNLFDSCCRLDPRSAPVAFAPFAVRPRSTRLAFSDIFFSTTSDAFTSSIVAFESSLDALVVGLESSFATASRARPVAVAVAVAVASIGDGVSTINSSPGIGAAGVADAASARDIGDDARAGDVTASRVSLGRSSARARARCVEPCDDE